MIAGAGLYEESVSGRRAIDVVYYSGVVIRVFIIFREGDEDAHDDDYTETDQDITAGVSHREDVFYCILFKEEERSSHSKTPTPISTANGKRVQAFSDQCPISQRTPMNATIPRIQAPMTSQPFIFIHTPVKLRVYHLVV